MTAVFLEQGAHMFALQSMFPFIRHARALDYTKLLDCCRYLLT
jgi:hypothetical protein